MLTSSQAQQYLDGPVIASTDDGIVAEKKGGCNSIGVALKDNLRQVGLMNIFASDDRAHARFHSTPGPYPRIRRTARARAHTHIHIYAQAHTRAHVHTRALRCTAQHSMFAVRRHQRQQKGAPWFASLAAFRMSQTRNVASRDAVMMSLFARPAIVAIKIHAVFVRVCFP